MHENAPSRWIEPTVGRPPPDDAVDSPDAPGLTLGRLLAHDELGLKLVAGGPGSHGRTVTGALQLDAEAASAPESVEEGTLALAPGALWGFDAERQRSLLAKLTAQRAAALGVTVNDADSRLPRQLLEEALRLGFPLFVIPSPTTGHEMVRLVEADKARCAVDAMRRSLSGQEYLMEALREPRPVDALVRRLAWLLAGEAVLFSDAGHVVTMTGRTRVDELWMEIAGREAAQQRFELGTSQVTSVPVVIGGRVRYWLAAVTRRHAGSEDPWGPLLRVVVRMLELVAVARTLADDDEQALRAGLLTGALEERDPRRLQEIAQRAERFGITYAEPCRVVVAAPRAPGRWAGAPSGPSPTERLRRVLSAAHRPYLLDEQPGRLIALVQGDGGEVDRWVAQLGGDGVDLVAGLGRRHATLRDAQGSLLDAQLAAEQVGPGRGGAVFRFEDCDLARWVIGVAADRLAPKAEALIAEIKADERLWETLVAYLEHDLDVRATASALHLHVNSVRYRLGKLEKLLGRSLRRVSTLADLYIAVTVDRTTANALTRQAS